MSSILPYPKKYESGHGMTKHNDTLQNS